MQLQLPVTGGVNATRGNLFQTYGLLFYLLIRRVENPNLTVIVEPDEGEDAKFIYPFNNNGSVHQTVEFVQYKKRESFKSANPPSFSMNQDDWREGKVKLEDIRKWVVETHPPQSVATLLESDPRAYYTLIVFGKVKDDAKSFAPLLPSLLTFAYPAEFLKAFPADYEHAADPLSSLNKKSFATEGIRRRIRLLRFGSISVIEAQCRQLLEEEPYGCSPRLSRDVLNNLLIEIRAREGRSDEKSRSILPGDFEAIIAAGRAPQGKWQPAKELLEHQDSDAHWTSKLTWDAFEAGQYSRLDEFEEAWQALKRDGFIAVCGPAGQGKSTLAMYMAYRFLKTHPTGTAYYLRPAATSVSDNDIRFLQEHIARDSLFIVDDQHFAIDAVEALVTAFTDYWAQGMASAKLVVTSTITYSRAPVVFGRARSELSRATLIPLLPLNRERMIRVLEGLRKNSDFHSPIGNSDLADLSSGNIALALLLARCAEDAGPHIQLRRFFESSSLKTLITEWILRKLGRKGETTFFVEEIVPALIVSSAEVAIPHDFTSAINELAAAGFLEVEEDNEIGVGFRPANRKLTMLVHAQYRSSEVPAWSLYLKKYPRNLPVVAESLGYNTWGRWILKNLVSDNFQTFLEVINNQLDPISLDEVGKILQAVNLADRRRGSAKLLRAIAAPYGEVSSQFFRKFICAERVREVPSLTRFLDTVIRIDRYLMRQLAEMLLSDRERSFILGLFQLKSSRADDIAACLKALSRCSREFAKDLYEQWKASSFSDSVTKIENDPRRLFVWLRFCENIRYVNRDDCHTVLRERLPANEIIKAIERGAEFSQMSIFLLRLRGLRPKLAADILVMLMEEKQALLEQRLRREPDLISLDNDLYVISKLNRRSAIKLASRLKPEIEALTYAETRYDKLGSAMDNSRKSIGASFVGEMASWMNRDHILEALRQEKQRFALVGRFLCSLAEVAPQIASWFEQRLDYSIYARRIHVLLLYNYTYVMRGFLAAADPWPDNQAKAGSGPSRRESLLQQMIGDVDLTIEFNKGFKEANLTEIAFCISHLINASISPKDLTLLLGFENFASLKAEILQKSKRDNSLMHIVNGLFASAKLNADLALELLEQYVQRIRSAESPRSTESAEHAFRSHESQLPKGYQPNDLVDVGSLLRIAAAVDLTLAREIAASVKIEIFAKYATNEASLGRLAVFLLGLHEVSRKLSREFVELTCSEENWSRQYQENELLDNALHYGRALTLISRTKASSYVSFIINNYQEEIEAELDIESNLMTVANWLRTLKVSGKEFAQQHAKKLSSLLLLTADYDTRMRHLLEATEALCECGELDLARDFAERAAKQSHQMRFLHRLQDWIVLFHKSLRIGRDLQMPDFASRIFSELDDWYFLTRLIACEKEPLLVAYTSHLLQSISVPGFASLKSELAKRRPSIVAEVNEESRHVFRALGLILARAPLNLISESANNGYQHWERGLTALMFANVYPQAENPFTLDSDSLSAALDGLANENGEHVGNLEFGLTLHLAAMSGMPADALLPFRTAALARVEDESVGAIRWLLSREPGVIGSSGLEHYPWVWIKNTVLRPTYVSWEKEVEGAADSSALKHQHTRDLEALLA